MRLATITNWAYAITVALTLASGGTMLAASRAQQQERAAVAQRYELDQLTSRIGENAVALSGLARQFAITGSPADLLAYREEASRLASVESRTRRIRDVGAGITELDALHDALRWADGLQGQQKAALTARLAGRRDLAIDVLFSPAYERELDRIRAAVERFQYHVDQRTDAAVRNATGKAVAWQTAAQVMLSITGLLVLAVLFFVFRQRVLRPVVKLSDVVTRLAAQDFDAVPPDTSQVDEIGDMAEALRIFRTTGIERQRLERERDADRVIRDLLSRMTQRMQSCDTTDDLKSVVQRFLPEIAPNLAGSLHLLDPARGAIVEATSWQGPSHSRAEFAPLACWALRRGSAHRPAGDQPDIPCGHLICENGSLPDTICLPLIGQNGTLGLLYLEPLPGAALSDLPDIYLSMLAENIGLALDNLRLREALRGMAMADALTTLANRRQLDAVLDIELNRSEQGGTPISCIMADIDHFKRFNDEVGHDAGDAVLQAVGRLLKQSVRESDLVFRYGGEEFLILLPGMGPDEAERRAEEIRSAVAELQVPHGGRDLGPVTISLGVATAPEHCDRGRLVQSADAILLRAKREGRNRVVTAVARASRAA